MAQQAASQRKTAVDEVDEFAPNPAVTAIRVTIEEVDGTGKALRKFGSLIPRSEVNPHNVAAQVGLTISDLVGIPRVPAPALTAQSVE